MRVRVVVIAALVVAQLVLVNLVYERTLVRRPSPSPLPAPPVASGPPVLPGQPVVGLPREGIALGVYDPAGGFDAAPGVLLDHVYVPWRLHNTDELERLVGAARSRGRMPLVGLEPWPFEIDGLSKETLFADIVAGRYDPTIAASCRAMARDAPQPVLLRWAHEMDLTGRFPWAQGDPAGYIQAYRHVVHTCRATGASNVQYVWSPAGDVLLQDYWPGAAWVDYVGVTALGFSDWDLFRGQLRPATFEEVFGYRYALVAEFRKPIIIAEFGAAGTPDHQRAWIADAFASMRRYPLLRAVVYFNAVDPVKWDNFKVPDWRVPPSLFPPRPGDLLPRTMTHSPPPEG